MNNNDSTLIREEEFTFPVISTNKVVHLTLLPPLWRISSINQSDVVGVGDDLDDSIGEGIIIRKRKIEQYLQGRVCGNDDKSGDEDEDEDEEKMDVLWEDFNEELLQVSSNCEAYAHNDDDLKEEFEVGQSLNNIKRTKRKNLELVGKILKRVFLVHNKTKRGHG